MNKKTVSIFGRIENGTELELGKINHDTETETDYALMEKLADLYAGISREIRDKNREEFEFSEPTDI